jgi:hypothetical protein
VRNIPGNTDRDGNSVDQCMTAAELKEVVYIHIHAAAVECLLLGGKGRCVDSQR